MNSAICYAVLISENTNMTGSYAAIWAAVFLLIILPIITRRRNETAIIKAINRRNDKKESEEMNELAKSFIEKDCIIYLFNGNQYMGRIKEVADRAMLIDKDGANEIINLDFVARIREYPKKKNGKKKSVVLD